MKSINKRTLTVTALYALIPLLLILVPHLFAKAQMQAYDAAYNTYMVLVEFAVVALPALIWLLTKHGCEAAKDFWRKKPDATILLVIPLAVCAYFCANGITVAWFVLLQQLGITHMPETVPAPQSAAQLGIGMAIIALTPAACEEFFFRGILQPTLHRNMKPWVAIVLGGCMFGLVHGQIVAMPAHVILGMGLCLVAYWTRSIWPTLLWHFIQNGIAVVISYFSESILQATGSVDASTAMLTEGPAVMLLSAGMMAVLFGGGVILFGALLYITTHIRPKAAEVSEEAQEKADLWAYAPLIAAFGGILYLYITGTMQLTGGGM